jgi:hypothetical protein
LVYADKKYNEIKGKDNNYKFSDIVKDYTPLENIILRPVFQLEEFNFKKYQEKIDKKINKIMKDDLYKDKEILIDRS